MLQERLLNPTRRSLSWLSQTNFPVHSFPLVKEVTKQALIAGRTTARGMCRSILIALACATVLGNVTGCNSASAEKPPAPSSTYNPYPPGILPSDLESEIPRVRTEVRGIFSEALAEWSALAAPTVAGNPPKPGTGYQAVQILGKLENFDENISPFRNQACAFCHMPYTGFSGPIPSVNLTMIAYPGTVHFRAGKRTAPRYTYSPDWPVLELNDVFATFIGGNFWDARATGYLLQSPDAEQAQHPPVDTQEMGLPDTACIAFRLSQATYRPLFEQIWGDSFDISWPSKTEDICDTPAGAAVFGGNATPVALSSTDRTHTNNIYDHWAQSISFFERSNAVSPFSSKFDAFLVGTYKMTPDEMAGYKLFNGKGQCNQCHLDGLSTQPAGTTDAGMAADIRPLFTAFFYVNIGLPLNPRNAFLYQTKPDSDGFTPNPDGFAYRDLGLGTFLRSASNPNSQWVPFAPASDGMMATASLRDVALVPPQCPTTEAPGPYFQKEFYHNGYAKSLKQVVHFYNTRDVYAYPVTSGHCPAGTTEKVNCWPMPEVANNLNMTVGNLGLTDQEEDQIVAFLLTLNDGFTKPYPDLDTFTGTCMTGGSASTQGNDSLIPTPPLPPCASAICDVAPLPTKPIP